MESEENRKPRRKSPSKVEIWLEGVAALFERLIGPFWFPIIVDTVRDAVGAYIVLSVGGFAGRLIAGKDFGSFAACFKEWQTDGTGVTPYVCYGMVLLDFVMWAAVLGRLLIRAFGQLFPQSAQETMFRKLPQYRKLQQVEPPVALEVPMFREDLHDS